MPQPNKCVQRLKTSNIVSHEIEPDFAVVAYNVEHCRSLGIRCCVRPVLLLIKGTNYFYDYQSKPAHYERSKMRRRINKRSTRKPKIGCAQLPNMTVRPNCGYAFVGCDSLLN